MTTIEELEKLCNSQQILIENLKKIVNLQEKLIKEQKIVEKKMKKFFSMFSILYLVITVLIAATLVILNP